MTYDNLLVMADTEGLIVKEKPLKGNKGRIKGNKIAIKKDLPTLKEKSCVLAEELGHYYTSVGNILDQTNSQNCKQELKARLWAYNKQIGLMGIINAYKAKCHNLYEMADYLNVTEEFLSEALSQYRTKYGTCVQFDNYVIYFVPNLWVMELL